MHNLTLLLYTHSKVQDLHNLFLGQIKKHFPQLDNILVLCDIDIPGVKVCLYNDSSKYYEQIVNSLNLVDTDFILYCQEDYILFDDVNILNLQNTLTFLRTAPDVGFVRLIQSGIENSTDYNNDFLLLDSNHQYYFSTQATIWRKDILKKIFAASKANSIRDEIQNSQFLKQIDCKGLCTKLKGEKIGGHYNSLIFPYVATALVNGKWNYSEYENALDKILSEYKIDKNIRGVR
jgi:hypothetical protein